MGTWKYLLASFVALAGCDMSKAPTEDTINPIIQQRIQACKRLVAWVIAREEQQTAQSGWVNVEFRGTKEAVQIQRDPKKPEQLYSIKAVRLADWSIIPFSIWNGIWGETGKWVDNIVNENAKIVLGYHEEGRRVEWEWPQIVPTCTYKSGKYSVEGASNYSNFRYRVVTQGL